VNKISKYPSRQQKRSPSQKPESPDSGLSAILKKLPSQLKKQEKQVPRLYTNYKESRLELGKILSQVQEKLAGSRQFKKYLDLRKIPKATAYDLIDAYKSPEKAARKKARPATFKEHQEGTFTIVTNRTMAYFLTLKQNQADLHRQLEIFMLRISEALVPDEEQRKAFLNNLGDKSTYSSKSSGMEIA
jgi:hypothetical protein